MAGGQVVLDILGRRTGVSVGATAGISCRLSDHTKVLQQYAHVCECFIMRSPDVYARHGGAFTRFMPLDIATDALVQSSSGSGRTYRREAGRSPRLQA